MPGIQSQTHSAINSFNPTPEVPFRQLRLTLQTLGNRLFIRRVATWKGQREQLLQLWILCLTKAQITGDNDLEDQFAESIACHGFWFTIFEEIFKQIHPFGRGVFPGMVREAGSEMLIESSSRFVRVRVGMLSNPMTMLANDMRCSLGGINDLKNLSPVWRGFFGFECEAESCILTLDVSLVK
jgi:hypothetical protein